MCETNFLAETALIQLKSFGLNSGKRNGDYAGNVLNRDQDKNVIGNRCLRSEVYRHLKKIHKTFEYPPQAAIFRTSGSTFDPRHLSSGVFPESLAFNTSAP